MPQMDLCTTLHITLASHWAHNEDALEKIICDYVSGLGEYFPAVKTLVIGNDGFPWDFYVSHWNHVYKYWYSLITSNWTMC